VCGSQPGEGGLGHPQATYMSPKFFLLLACLSLGMGALVPEKGEFDGFFETWAERTTLGGFQT
jgi:hypothetical protein